jgi:hypothetical protein
MTIDPMDPAGLDELLATCRRNGVASARITATEVAVTFEPSIPTEPLPGTVPEPGGWKSPPNLDSPSMYEVP